MYVYVVILLYRDIHIYALYILYGMYVYTHMNIRKICI